MDTKVTKERVMRHLEYDWYKYLLILLGAILLWAMIFTSINNVRSHEQITFFINAPGLNSEAQAAYSGILMERLKEEGDEVIVEVSLSQNAGTASMSELLQTRPLTSDFLVFEERIFHNWFSSGVKYTDEIIGLLGIEENEGVYSIGDIEIEFNEPFEISDGSKPVEIKEKYGIKLNGLKGISGFMSSFRSVYYSDEYSTKEARKKVLEAKEPLTEAEQTELDGLIADMDYLETATYYLMISASADNLGPVVYKKAKAENKQGITAFKTFFELYGKAAAA